MAAAMSSFSLEYSCGTRQNAHWLIPGPIPSWNGPFFFVLRTLSERIYSQARGSNSRCEGWWACLDLNQGPSGYEPVALTTELQALRRDSNASGDDWVRCRVGSELREFSQWKTKKRGNL